MNETLRETLQLITTKSELITAPGFQVAVQYLDAHNPHDLNLHYVVVDATGDQRQSGLSPGNVTFCAEDQERMKKLHLDPRVLNLEILYDNPENQKIQEGIYLTILDVVGKAHAVGFSDQQINIAAYLDIKNQSSMQVVKNLGFEEMGLLVEYSANDPKPRFIFHLGGRNWKQFTSLYPEII